MARRGQFGRLPRAVPSLTATIVGIAQQMLADQDRNLMSAWQNGGTYEGKPVTDKMVLEHWQQRLSGVSKSDPLYDTYKNNVAQLQYKIAYSKQYTSYLKGGRTDNLGMANFFQSWSKKIPHNSDFYRTLQQDAAGYVNLARSAARAGAAQAKVDNFNRNRVSIDRQYIQPAAIVNNALDNYARANGLIGQTQSIEYLNPENTARFYDMLANADPNTFLYNGQGGNPVTVGDIRNQVGRASPDMRFGFTAEDINRMNLRAVKGSTMEVRLARQNGYSDWQNHYTSQRDVYGRRARESGIMPIEEQYVHAREQFNQEMNDPTTGVEAKAKAWQTYTNTLESLAGQSTDPNTRSRLAAEMNGDPTANSLAEDVFGFGKSPDVAPGTLGTAPSGISDIANEQMQAQLLLQQQQAATGGTGVWTKGDIVPIQNASGQTTGYQFVASPTGQTVGLTTDPAVIQRLLAIDPATGQPGANAAPVVTLPSAWGSDQLKDVHVEWMPVTVRGMPTVTTGNSAPSTLVAESATIVVDGVSQTSYKYVNNGRTYITPYAPWSSTLPVTHNADGSITVDASGLLPTGQNAVALAASNPTLYQLQIANVGVVDPTKVTQNADGTYTVPDPKDNTKTVIVGSGQLIQALVTDPAATLYSTDPTRAAGPSPTEDFKSLTQSMLAGSPGGQAEWDKLNQDPAFQQRIWAEVQANTTDPVTGQVDIGGRTAAGIQVFGGEIPGISTMANTPMGHTLFNWYVSHADGGANGNVNAAPGPQGTSQNLGSAQLGPPAPSHPYALQGGPPQPAPPSLASLGTYANGYDTLVKLGLAPAGPVARPTPPPQQVQIQPPVIRVPIAPPPQPVPQPAPPPTPVTPIYGPPVPPPPPVYGQHHAPGGGQ